MTFVIGRDAGPADGPVADLGTYRALDGSDGASLALDVDNPHAILVVGKRGYGKSYTVGVVAEALARTPNVAPVVVDPMGVFGTIAGESTGAPVPAAVVDEPSVTATSIDPRSWCSLLGLSPESGAGSLVWQAAAAADSLAGMIEHVATADAPVADERAARNHLELAASWDVFEPSGLTASDLASGRVTVVDVSSLEDAPTNAVARGVCESLYRARVEQSIGRLPWLLVDEAHTLFDGVAAPALRTVLTRGRAPGVSLVAATQRPSAVPQVAVSQSDLLLTHRLTSGEDLAALQHAQPTYMNGSLRDDERMPTDPGDVIIVDDATETVHAATIRSRDTPHGGDSPSASDMGSDSNCRSPDDCGTVDDRH